jgi:prephenate dehydrogenase
MEEPDFRKMKITIVGLGLIGGSYALALRKLSPKKIWAVDIDKDTLETAKRKGIIDEGFSLGTLPLKDSDLVIVCLYPELAISFIKENLEHFKKDAIITDVVGNKKKVIEEIKLFLRKDLDFVGGHPLAGKECSGFAHASADIFLGANYLLTPVSGNKRESLQLLKKMIRGLGCKEAFCLDPEEHDKIIAFTSQLPHVLAAALINSSGLKNIDNLIGGSFRDATRVARMNVDLWTELLMENRENILTEVEVFVDNLAKIQLALQKEDCVTLRAILEQANKEKEAFK